MKILLLSHSFNSLTQRLFVELTRRNHLVSIELDINDTITLEAAELFSPNLIIAPFLLRAIPSAVWQSIPCFIVHPGPPGDRGPSSLDWAILQNEKEWGVTVLQANAEMDAGDIWAWSLFPMRWGTKGSLYRHEVAEAAVAAVLLAIQRFESKEFRPQQFAQHFSHFKSNFKPLMQQKDRAINWTIDSMEAVVRKINSADGSPGVLDSLFDENVYLYNAIQAEPSLVFDESTKPGEIVGWGARGLLRRTRDGAVWLGHLRKQATLGTERSLKLSARLVFADQLDTLPQVKGQPEVVYMERNKVGYITFDFYNGAMSAEQCDLLRRAIVQAKSMNIRVLVLMGGRDFWSNGIHLHQIEAAFSPADESWRNIEAMNDLTHEILTISNLITMSALRGNAGGGGVFLALGADYVFARTGVILNPHYKAMGNLFGSEYWTYTLPRRTGSEVLAQQIVNQRLPLSTAESKSVGLIDDFFSSNLEEFESEIRQRAESLAHQPDFSALLARKNKNRESDESKKPLAAYRTFELEQMKLNFYGFDPSYHIARYNFTYRIPKSRTPRHLALHRLGKNYNSGTENSTANCEMYRSAEGSE